MGHDQYMTAMGDTTWPCGHHAESACPGPERTISEQHENAVLGLTGEADRHQLAQPGTTARALSPGQALVQHSVINWCPHCVDTLLRCGRRNCLAAQGRLDEIAYFAAEQAAAIAASRYTFEGRLYEQARNYAHSRAKTEMRKLDPDADDWHPTHGSLLARLRAPAEMRARDGITTELNRQRMETISYQRGAPLSGGDVASDALCRVETDLLLQEWNGLKAVMLQAVAEKSPVSRAKIPAEHVLAMYINQFTDYLPPMDPQDIEPAADAELEDTRASKTTPQAQTTTKGTGLIPKRSHDGVYQAFGGQGRNSTFPRFVKQVLLPTLQELEERSGLPQAMHEDPDKNRSDHETHSPGTYPPRGRPSNAVALTSAQHTALRSFIGWLATGQHELPTANTTTGTSR